jgi:nucleoside-diphosphate-sugar epimerase
MIDAYQLMLELPEEKIAGRIYNVGYENHTVRQLAELVRNVVGREKVEMVTLPSADNRSYHISSEKIARELGFRPKLTVSDAARDLAVAFANGLLPNSMTDSRYINIRRMQEIKLR